jgi:hypothetical protein
MSTAPISREIQIELMKSYAERRAVLFDKVSNDPAIKSSLSRNAFSEEEHSEYMRSDTRVTMCG